MEDDYDDCFYDELSRKSSLKSFTPLSLTKTEISFEENHSVNNEAFHKYVGEKLFSNTYNPILEGINYLTLLQTSQTGNEVEKEDTVIRKIEEHILQIQHRHETVSLHLRKYIVEHNHEFVEAFEDMSKLSDEALSQSHATGNEEEDAQLTLPSSRNIRHYLQIIKTASAQGLKSVRLRRRYQRLTSLKINVEKMILIHAACQKIVNFINTCDLKIVTDMLDKTLTPSAVISNRGAQDSNRVLFFLKILTSSSYCYSKIPSLLCFFINSDLLHNADNATVPVATLPFFKSLRTFVWSPSEYLTEPAFHALVDSFSTGFSVQYSRSCGSCPRLHQVKFKLKSYVGTFSSIISAAGLPIYNSTSHCLSSNFNKKFVLNIFSRFCQELKERCKVAFLNIASNSGGKSFVYDTSDSHPCNAKIWKVDNFLLTSATQESISNVLLGIPNEKKEQCTREICIVLSELWKYIYFIEEYHRVEILKLSLEELNSDKSSKNQIDVTCASECHRIALSYISKYREGNEMKFLLSLLLENFLFTNRKNKGRSSAFVTPTVALKLTKNIMLLAASFNYFSSFNHDQKNQEVNKEITPELNDSHASSLEDADFDCGYEIKNVFRKYLEDVLIPLEFLVFLQTVDDLKSSAVHGLQYFYDNEGALTDRTVYLNMPIPFFLSDKTTERGHPTESWDRDVRLIFDWCTRGIGSNCSNPFERFFSYLTMDHSDESDGNAFEKRSYQPMTLSPLCSAHEACLPSAEGNHHKKQNPYHLLYFFIFYNITTFVSSLPLCASDIFSATTQLLTVVLYYTGDIAVSVLSDYSTDEIARRRINLFPSACPRQFVDAQKLSDFFLNFQVAGHLEPMFQSMTVTSERIISNIDNLMSDINGTAGLVASTQSNAKNQNDSQKNNFSQPASFSLWISIPKWFSQFIGDTIFLRILYRPTTYFLSPLLFYPSGGYRNFSGKQPECQKDDSYYHYLNARYAYLHGKTLLMASIQCLFEYYEASWMHFSQSSQLLHTDNDFLQGQKSVTPKNKFLSNVDINLISNKISVLKEMLSYLFNTALHRAARRVLSMEQPINKIDNYTLPGDFLNKNIQAVLSRIRVEKKTKFFFWRYKH